MSVVHAEGEAARSSTPSTKPHTAMAHRGHTAGENPADDGYQQLHNPIDNTYGRSCARPACQAVSPAARLPGGFSGCSRQGARCTGAPRIEAGSSFAGGAGCTGAAGTGPRRMGALHTGARRSPGSGGGCWYSGSGWGGSGARGGSGLWNGSPWKGSGSLGSKVKWGTWLA